MSIHMLKYRKLLVCISGFCLCGVVGGHAHLTSFHARSSDLLNNFEWQADVKTTVHRSEINAGFAFHLIRCKSPKHISISTSRSCIYYRGPVRRVWPSFSGFLNVESIKRPLLAITRRPCDVVENKTAG